MQPSSSRQTTVRSGAMRRGREKGDLGVWFGSQVCILACEGARGWRRKSAAIHHSDCTRSTFWAGVPAQGACPMLNQELRALPKLLGNRAGFRSRSLAGRGLGLCGPIEKQYSDHSALLWVISPPLPSAYKRGSAELLALLTSLPLLRCLPFAVSSLAVSLLVCGCQDMLLLQSLIRGDC